MKILAGIVLYNPDIERLKNNVEAIVNQVDGLIFIDNCSSNIDEIEQCLKPLNKSSLIIRNSRNKGIAAALNQIVNYANRKYDWVLTLDQDSVCQNNLVNIYRQYIDLPDVGMLSCNVIDRNFTVDYEYRTDESYKEVQTCITSGALINCKAYRKTKGFDESMFIDWVDFDMCYALLEAGFRIYRINYNGILHEVGHGKTVNLFGKSFETYNHSVFRSYYVSRNTIYTARKHPDKLSLYRAVRKNIRIMANIVLYEDDKIPKVLNGIRGMIKGFFVRIDYRDYVKRESL